jgi:hypothetical protein
MVPRSNETAEPDYLTVIYSLQATVCSVQCPGSETKASESSVLNRHRHSFHHFTSADWDATTSLFGRNIRASSLHENVRRDQKCFPEIAFPSSSLSDCFVLFSDAKQANFRNGR